MTCQDTHLVRLFGGPNYAAEVQALSLARAVLRLLAAADDMPDTVACDRLGADTYKEEFEELTASVKLLKALLP